MPTIYEAKLDGSNAIRYFHFSLVGFYLNQAYDHAIQAKEDHGDGVLLASSIVGIMFSSMALEAFVNEMSEDIIPKEELNDFLHLRKAYKHGKKESSLVAKTRILFEKRFSHPLSIEHLNGIENLASLRNNLVHYKLSELAGKYIMPPVKTTQLGDGRYMTTLDFMAQPERVDPPFLLRISGYAAADCFNTALSVINSWGALLGEPDNTPGLKRI